MVPGNLELFSNEQNRRWSARPNTILVDSTQLESGEAMSAEFKKWQCFFCGYIYDEALGDPDTGIPPGTKWEDVPPNWTCPDCGARKEDYELVEF